jgi:TPR repeat protein
VEAANWYRKGAEAGNTFSMLGLGFMYAGGYGVPRDEIAAIGWIRKSADAGNVTAMKALGTMFEKGIGWRQMKRRPLDGIERPRRSETEALLSN